MRHVLLGLLLLGWVPLAWGFGTGAAGCSGDCASCHPMTLEEAQGVVGKLDKSIVVERVAPAPVRGLHQLQVKKGTASGVFYLDFSKRYLVQGEIIDIGERRSLTSEAVHQARKAAEEKRRVDTSLLAKADSLVLGNPAGSKRLYVVTDPECPYCAKFHQTLTELVAEDGELAVRIILLPLEMHPDAIWKSNAILCRAKQDMGAGLKLLEQNFSGQPLAMAAVPGCKTDYGKRGKELGAKLGIDMTPSVIFADGRIRSGNLSKEELKSLLATPTK